MSWEHEKKCSLLPLLHQGFYSPNIPWGCLSACCTTRWMPRRLASGKCWRSPLQEASVSVVSKGTEAVSTQQCLSLSFCCLLQATRSINCGRYKMVCLDVPEEQKVCNDMKCASTEEVFRVQRDPCKCYNGTEIMEGGMTDDRKGRGNRQCLLDLREYVF